MRWGWVCAMGLVGLVSIIACADEASEPTPWEWDLPAGFPTPEVPDDNPMTVEKVELGRHLFYERRLSADESMSCASCHQQEHAFSDPRAQPEGITGEAHPRTSMSLTNVAYDPTLNWANPVVTSLEDQALIPLFGDDPVELGLHTVGDQWLDRLDDDPVYQELFAAAYPSRDDPIELATVLEALASFQRTLISGDSPYDRYIYGGEEEAMSEAAREGMQLFFSERLECFHCHGGFNMASDVNHAGTVFEEASFHNTGLYNYDHVGGYPPPNTGLHEFTGEPSDMGRFKAPTLRNIEYTAPYMHDGSAADLDAVIDHYEAAGRTIHSGPWAGDGSQNPFKSEFIVGFQLSDEERDALKAFLRSLSDPKFLARPELSDPWDKH